MMKCRHITVVLFLLISDRSALAQVIHCQWPAPAQALGGQPMGCIFLPLTPQDPAGNFRIALESDLSPLSQQINTANAQIASLNGTTSSLQKQVAALQSALVQQQQDNDKLKTLLLQTLDNDSILQNPTNLASLEQQLQVFFDSRYAQKTSN